MQSGGSLLLGIVWREMGAIIGIHTGKRFKSVMGFWPVNRKESPGIQLKPLRYARHPVAVTATR